MPPPDTYQPKLSQKSKFVVFFFGSLPLEGLLAVTTMSFWDFSLTKIKVKYKKKLEFDTEDQVLCAQRLQSAIDSLIDLYIQYPKRFK